MDYEDKIAKETLQAILDGNIKLLHEYAHDIDNVIYELGYYPESLYESLHDIISRPEFHALNKSWYLLKVFENNIEELTDIQKERLLEIFEKTYELFADSTSCMLLSELIAEIFTDERSLQLLIRLKKVRADMPRAMIPHGFQYFIEGCGDNNLRERALQELKQMNNDISSSVKNEVRLALHNLEKRTDDV